MPPSLLVPPVRGVAPFGVFPSGWLLAAQSPRVRGVRSGRALLDPADWFTPVRGAPCGRLWTSESNLCFIPAGAGRRSPEARRGHSGSGPSPCPVALPEETASRIDLGRRDLSRRARGAPAPRVSGSGAGPRNAQGSPSARMILRAISPASLWPARDRHGNSPIVAMAIRRGIYRGMRDRRRTVRRGPLSGSIARLDARHGVVVPPQLTASDRFHALAQGLQVRSHDAGQLDHDVAHEPGGPEDGDHDHTNANGQLHVVTHVGEPPAAPPEVQLGPSGRQRTIPPGIAR